MCLTACCLVTGDKFLLLFPNACLVHNRACTCYSQIHVALKMYAILACQKYSYICIMSNYMFFLMECKSHIESLELSDSKAG